MSRYSTRRQHCRDILSANGKFRGSWREYYYNITYIPSLGLTPCRSQNANDRREKNTKLRHDSRGGDCCEVGTLVQRLRSLDVQIDNVLLSKMDRTITADAAFPSSNIFTKNLSQTFSHGIFFTALLHCVYVFKPTFFNQRRENLHIFSLPVRGRRS